MDSQINEKDTPDIDELVYKMYELVNTIVEKENENIKSHELTDDQMVNFIQSLIKKETNS
jgi:hypothetical protein